MLDNTGRKCLIQTGIGYEFRHLQFWLKGDAYAMVEAELFQRLLWTQRIGNVRPTGPVYLEQNRSDPFGPYHAARQTAIDWCATGADVTSRTNEQPPLFNGLDVYALLPPFVDGERSIASITDRFNWVPTTPTCIEL